MILSENPFHEILNKVIQLLNRRRGKKLILLRQYNKMLPNHDKYELAHLYFNPKTHKNDIPVRPIENTIRVSTTKISNYLSEIIGPIFDSKCQMTTIIDGSSLIKKFHQYVRRNRLKPSTLFCTFDISNLCTMLLQDEALDILVEFLRVHGYVKQILGGAMGSSFTLTLANIFMWKWQKELVRRQDKTGDFLNGKYIDAIFMTWNKSEKELKKALDEANTWHPNIKLEYKISKSLPFLDVLLTNNNGNLSTMVYHKPAAEPYAVPFIFDHPKHTFVNVIQTSLTRAVRYLSTFETFNNERCYIKLTLLLNG
ncbi:unnamed protein product, partial [Rotaria sp. Silwood2]